MKSKLFGVADQVLKMIDNGDDFIVTEYDFGKRLKLPVVKEDSEPHVCDFLKAGADKDLIAYYFAYIICSPGYEVFSIKQGKYLQADAKPNFSDENLIVRFEEKYIKNAVKCKLERKEKEKGQELWKEPYGSFLIGIYFIICLNFVWD